MAVGVNEKLRGGMKGGLPSYEWIRCFPAGKHLSIAPVAAVVPRKQLSGVYLPTIEPYVADGKNKIKRASGSCENLERVK